MTTACPDASCQKGFMHKKEMYALLNEDVFEHSAFPSSHSTTHEKENWTSIFESYRCHHICTLRLIDLWFWLSKSNCFHFVYQSGGGRYNYLHNGKIAQALSPF